MQKLLYQIDAGQLLKIGLNNKLILNQEEEYRIALLIS